jgi:hypothetical protein
MQFQPPHEIGFKNFPSIPLNPHDQWIFQIPLSTHVVGNMFGGLATKIMVAKLGQTLVSHRQTHWFFVAHHFACKKLCCAK